MPKSTKIYFDGGARPNPGAMEIAVVIGGQAHIRRDLGHGSSMDAEWLALIEARVMARSLGIPDAVFLGDAAAVLAQASGKARCPAAFRSHREAFLALADGGGQPRLRYVKRSQNLAGIALAKLHPR